LGGVVADEFGLTSVPGILAVCEAACTGVHGANRLASNSLLEGLVFGRKAAGALHMTPGGDANEIDVTESGDPVEHVSPKLAEIRDAIQRAMSRHVSVVRDAAGLMTAIAELEQVAARLPAEPGDRGGWITTNMATAALAIATAALLREESRGAHFRSDFPERNPTLDGVHFVYRSDQPGTGGWSEGALSSVIPAVRT
jgi:L-aspartate oxidase